MSQVTVPRSPVSLQGPLAHRSKAHSEPELAVEELLFHPSTCFLLASQAYTYT